jgi:hypothetical protein
MVDQGIDILSILSLQPFGVADHISSCISLGSFHFIPAPSTTIRNYNQSFIVRDEGASEGLCKVLSFIDIS